MWNSGNQRLERFGRGRNKGRHQTGLLPRKNIILRHLEVCVVCQKSEQWYTLFLKTLKKNQFVGYAVE